LPTRLEHNHGNPKSAPAEAGFPIRFLGESGPGTDLSLEHLFPSLSLTPGHTPLPPYPPIASNLSARYEAAAASAALRLEQRLARVNSETEYADRKVESLCVLGMWAASTGDLARADAVVAALAERVRRHQGGAPEPAEASCQLAVEGARAFTAKRSGNGGEVVGLARIDSFGSTASRPG
jgi:hypothetical protein